MVMQPLATCLFVKESLILVPNFFLHKVKYIVHTGFQLIANVRREAIRVFHSHTKLVIMPTLPTLSLDIFAVFFFICIN